MAICDPTDQTYQAVFKLLDENESHFLSDESEAGQRLHGGLGALRDGLEQLSGELILNKVNCQYTIAETYIYISVLRQLPLCLDCKKWELGGVASKDDFVTHYLWIGHNLGEDNAIFIILLSSSWDMFELLFFLD